MNILINYNIVIGDNLHIAKVINIILYEINSSNNIIPKAASVVKPLLCKNKDNKLRNLKSFH